VNARRVVVRSIAWLDFCAWFVDELIIKWAIALASLAAADRTSLNVATKNVDLSSSNAAIMTGLAPAGTPIFLLLAIPNALVNLATDAKRRGDALFCHRDVNLTRIRRMFVFKGEQLFVYFGGHG
jgi:hypothetical protein